MSLIEREMSAKKNKFDLGKFPSAAKERKEHEVPIRRIVLHRTKLGRAGGARHAGILHRAD